jgi:uncharacterized cupin superfamily protein
MIVDPASAPVSGEKGLSTLHISVAGGLTQFGAYVDTLQPEAWSSHRHWHEAEDECIYVLDGTVTLRDDDGMHDLLPGDAAVWPHGCQNGHHLTNRGDTPCRYLIVGSRVAGDVCHYSDDGRRQVNGQSTWQVLDADGNVLRGGDLPPELLNLPPVWGKPFDTASPARRILRKGSVAPESGSGYPESYDDLGEYQAFPISDEGGLSQFGAFTETLMPGAQSSQRHWHQAEDEFLYVLDGAVTLIEDDGAHVLRPGDCACWPAGVANGHTLRNDTDAPVTYFVAGSRLPEDTVHYPDIDMHYTRKGGLRTIAHKDGTPYPGWPKETNR